jgi:hypothetical protein
MKTDYIQKVIDILGNIQDAAYCDGRGDIEISNWARQAIELLLKGGEDCE